MKNKIIKAFRINRKASDKFEEAVKELNIPPAQLSRLLFNRGLKDLFESKVKAGGWNKLSISIKEIN